MDDLPAGYESLERIGEGTFGVVVRAQRLLDSKVFALKKLRLRRLEEGIPKMVLREIKTLELCDHPNVMQLYEVPLHPTCFGGATPI